MKKPVLRILRLIDDAWSNLRQECDRDARTYRILRDAFDVSEEVERSHRRFMARGISRGEHGGYRVPVRACARLYVLRNAYSGPPYGDKPTWTEAAETRRDVLLSYALYDILRRENRHPKAFPADMSEFMAIDYAEDCAR